MKQKLRHFVHVFRGEEEPLLSLREREVKEVTYFVMVIIFYMSSSLSTFIFVSASLSSGMTKVHKLLIEILFVKYNDDCKELFNNNHL